MKWLELSEAEGARWQKAVAPMIEDWVKSMVARKFSETEVRGWITYMKERIAYWTAKQIEYKIPSPTGPAAMRPEAYVK